MRYLSCLFVLMCVLPLSRIVAAEPEVVTPPPAQTALPSSASPTAAAPTSDSTQSATAPVSTSAVSPATADAAKDAELEKQTKRLRSLGYKPKVVNGTTLFCHGEVMLGSHFERQVCGTADELDKVARQSKDTVNDIQRRSLLNNPSRN
jgi:hypothetical protein